MARGLRQLHSTWSTPARGVSFICLTRTRRWRTLITGVPRRRPVLVRRGSVAGTISVAATATARGLVGVDMASVPMRIVGRRLPGSSWSGRHGIHVGVQRGTEVVGLVTGDAADAVFDIDLEVVADGNGEPDFRGPYVHGRRGERFVYLSWGEVDDDGTFCHVPPAEAAPRSAVGAVLGGECARGEEDSGGAGAHRHPGPTARGIRAPTVGHLAHQFAASAAAESADRAPPQRGSARETPRRSAPDVRPTGRHRR